MKERHRMLSRRASASSASRRRASPLDAPLHLLKVVENHADAWRGAAADAAVAFSRWREASTADRRWASLAYLAAVEREEKAASEYERAWEGLLSAGR